MQVEYDYTVFIGRFQPLHKGHMHVIQTALQKSEKLIILVGSAQAALPAKFKNQQYRPLRNPFSFDERFQMIKRTYYDKKVVTLQTYQEDLIDEERNIIDIVVAPLQDHGYNDDAWVSSVQRIVTQITEPAWTDKPPKIALIGRKKDNSCYYLNLFPQWKSIEVQDDGSALNATDIRTDFIRKGQFAIGQNPKDYPITTKKVSEAVKQFLLDFANREKASLQQLHDDLMWNEKYKSMWKDAPYPVTHMTVDAVVVQSGHILLVRRDAQPGKGLWALPGGYINQDETLYDAAVRELAEETNISLSDFSLKAAFQGARTFDNPHRSDRGRVITTAHYFRLQDRTNLPPVKGSDDAREATWVPLSKLETNQLFEDHGQIIQAMLGI